MTSACAFGDPTCPCQDGDLCHYVSDGDTPAMTPPLCDGYEWRGEVPWRCTLPVGHKRDGVFYGRSCRGAER